MTRSSGGTRIALRLLPLTALIVIVLALAAAGCGGLPGRALALSGEYLRADLGQAERSIVEKYRQSIPTQMQQQNVPGLALAVVDERGIVWKAGLGCTDADCRTPVTPDTLFSVQSTSKSVTATAVMFAVQDGLVDLDTPVSAYLPDFHVQSVFEARPEDKMTLRHLLSHTAGFTHDPPHGNNNDLGPYSFEEHIRSISQTWLRFPVGTEYGYSNIGPDLAAYIVQKRAGKPFAQYVQERMLAPLGITRSSFDLEQARRDPNRAIGHSWPFARAPFDLPFTGAGGFYASASEMAQYIRFHINRGQVDGRPLLDSKLLGTMYASHYDGSARAGYGLGIARGRVEGLPFFSHGGGGMGFICDMLWYPDVRLGIILLTNSTDHTLQMKIAPGLLADLVRAEGSVYRARLVALHGLYPSLDAFITRSTTGGGGGAAVDAAPADGQDRARRSSYAGTYRVKTWNLVSELWRFEEKNGALYLDGSRLQEPRPGVFISTQNGETYDFTATREGASLLGPSGIYAEKAKNELTPVKQGILLLCALLLGSALIAPPLAWLVGWRRRRGQQGDRAAAGAGLWLASAVTALTAVLGLLSLAAIAAFPVVLYQDGFALGADLALDARLIMALPLGLGLAALVLVALNLLLWRRGGWSPVRRGHFAAVTLAAVALSLLLFGWNVVAFGF